MFSKLQNTLSLSRTQHMVIQKLWKLDTCESFEQNNKTQTNWPTRPSTISKFEFFSSMIDFYRSWCSYWKILLHRNKIFARFFLPVVLKVNKWLLYQLNFVKYTQTKYIHWAKWTDTDIMNPPPPPRHVFYLFFPYIILLWCFKLIIKRPYFREVFKVQLRRR